MTCTMCGTSLAGCRAVVVPSSVDEDFRLLCQDCALDVYLAVADDAAEEERQAHAGR